MPADTAHHVVPHTKGGTRTIPLCNPCHGLVHDHDFTGLSELVKAGIEKARANGKAIGRPKKWENFREPIRLLHEQNMHARDIGKLFHIPRSTVLRIIQDLKYEDSQEVQDQG